MGEQADYLTNQNIEGIAFGDRCRQCGAGEGWCQCGMTAIEREHHVTQALLAVYQEEVLEEEE